MLVIFPIDFTLAKCYEESAIKRGGDKSAAHELNDCLRNRRPTHQMPVS